MSRRPASAASTSLYKSEAEIARLVLGECVTEWAAWLSYGSGKGFLGLTQ